MPPESHPNYTITSLVWILFGLWCFSLVILSMAVFDMDIAEYNATCYLVNFYNFVLRNWVDKIFRKQWISKFLCVLRVECLNLTHILSTRRKTFKNDVSVRTYIGNKVSRFSIYLQSWCSTIFVWIRFF